MYKKILVAIDDSETSRSALREAMHIAKTSNAKLYITHVADETAFTTLTQAGQQLLDEAMKSATGIDAEALLLHATNRRVSEAIGRESQGARG
jgi:nucleotide-binding universal stress UspA family protein